jgi:ribosome-binding factor A
LIDPRIKLERAQSALYERLTEALAALNDDELNALVLLEVKLAKGKKDAHLFIDGSDIPQSERARLLAKLKRASGFMANFITIASGWFKSPKLHFVFDDRLQKASYMDELFKKINAK